MYIKIAEKILIDVKMWIQLLHRKKNIILCYFLISWPSIILCGYSHTTNSDVVEKNSISTNTDFNTCIGGISVVIIFQIIYILFEIIVFVLIELQDSQTLLMIEKKASLAKTEQITDLKEKLKLTSTLSSGLN